MRRDKAIGRGSQFFITTEDAEETENGHFTSNYGVFSVSSASSVVKNILLTIPAAYQKHSDSLGYWLWGSLRLTVPHILGDKSSQRGFRTTSRVPPLSVLADLFV